MKKTTHIASCLVVSMAVLCLQAFGNAEEHQGAGSPAMAKEAVSKVLAGHSFTPPVTVPGPQGTVWYISSRSLVAHSVEQAVIGVQPGNTFSVRLNVFRREKEQDPWKETTKSVSPAVLNLEKSIKEQLQKELGAEEKSAKPAK